MQKSISLAKVNLPSKAFMANMQTEELIADIRAILTPSQRVEEKLAACAGFSHTVARRQDESHAPRRPR